MKYKALEGFSGRISMVQGQVKEIFDESLANDLLKAGFIEEYVADEPTLLKEKLESCNLTLKDTMEQNEKLATANEELQKQYDELKAANEELQKQYDELSSNSKGSKK